MIGKLKCFIGRHAWFALKPLDFTRRATAAARTTAICLRCPARKKADGRVVFA